MPCEGKCLPFPRKLPFFVMQRKIWKEFGSSVLVHRATKVAYTYIKGFYFRNHVFLQIVKTYFRFRYLYRLSRAPSRLNTTCATKVAYIKESPHTETFTARFQNSKKIFSRIKGLYFRAFSRFLFPTFIHFRFLTCREGSVSVEYWCTGATKVAYIKGSPHKDSSKASFEA